MSIRKTPSRHSSGNGLAEQRKTCSLQRGALTKREWAHPANPTQAWDMEAPGAVERWCGGGLSLQTGMVKSKYGMVFDPYIPCPIQTRWSLSNRHGRTQDSPPFLRQLMEFVQRMRQERDEDMGPGVDCCLPVSVSTIHTCMCLNSSSSLSIPTIPLHLRLDPMKTCDFHLSWRSQTPISYSSTSHIFDTLFIPNYQK